MVDPQGLAFGGDNGGEEFYARWKSQKGFYQNSLSAEVWNSMSHAERMAFVDAYRSADIPGQMSRMAFNAATGGGRVSETGYAGGGATSITAARLWSMVESAVTKSISNHSFVNNGDGTFSEYRTIFYYYGQGRNKYGIIPFVEETAKVATVYLKLGVLHQKVGTIILNDIWMNGIQLPNNINGSDMNTLVNKMSITGVALSDIYISKHLFNKLPKWFVGKYGRTIVMRGAKDYTSILSIQLRRLEWQHGGRIVQRVGVPVMVGTTTIENGIYYHKIVTENPSLDEVKDNYNTPWNPIFWLWMKIEDQIR